MTDLISRQAAIDALVKDIRENPYYDSNKAINGLSVYDVRVILNDLASAQPERKNARWITVTNGRGGHECSRCHDYAPSYQNGDEYLANYCPNCGAKME